MAKAGKGAATLKDLPRCLSGPDLTPLGENERVAVYLQTCEALELDPATAPLVFHAAAGDGGCFLLATDDGVAQLLRSRPHRIEVRSREKADGRWLVTVRAAARFGEGADADAHAEASGFARCPMDAESIATARAVLALHGAGLPYTNRDVDLGSEGHPIAAVLEEASEGLGKHSRANLARLMGEAGADVKAFCAHFGIASGVPGDIHPDRYIEAVKMLEKKREQSRGGRRAAPPAQPHRQEQYDDAAYSEEMY